MNSLKVIALLAVLASNAGASGFNHNPDRYPSLGLDMIKGQVPGMLRAGHGDAQTNGGLVGARIDGRLPILESLTLHASAEALGINNNWHYTEGYRFELGARFYFISK
jgi:hypothetical protein